MIERNKTPSESKPQKARHSEVGVDKKLINMAAARRVAIIECI